MRDRQDVPRAQGDRPDQPGRILVILPNWLGDTVMAGPCLRALRRRYPAADITLLGKPIMAELLAGTGWFDRFAPWSGGLGARLNAAARLRVQAPDLCLLLPNSFSSALAARLSGAREIVGYRRDLRRPLLTRPLAWHGGAVPQVRSFLALAEACGCAAPEPALELPVSGADRRAAAPFLKALGRRPRVILNPDSQWPSKRWPAVQFAGLADELHREFGASVGVICGPDETDLAAQVRDASRTGAAAFVDPVAPLGALKALLSQCDLFVTNDSGPRHIAKAVGAPVVALFGPVAPGHTATESPRERVVYLDLPCSPCHKKRCPLGHHRCLRDMTVSAVMAAAREALAPWRAGAERQTEP
jgi:heptosyltransferase-2